METLRRLECFSCDCNMTRSPEFLSCCMKFTYWLSCTFLPFLLILKLISCPVCISFVYLYSWDRALCQCVFFVFVGAAAAAAARQKSCLCVGKHTEKGDWLRPTTVDASTKWLKIQNIHTPFVRSFDFSVFFLLSATVVILQNEYSAV